MSGKGKKNKKGSSEAGKITIIEFLSQTISIVATETAAVTKMTPELYELKIKDLEIKAEHW